MRGDPGKKKKKLRKQIMRWGGESAERADESLRTDLWLAGTSAIHTAQQWEQAT